MEEKMGLEAEGPFRMGLAIGCDILDILPGARLEKMPFRREGQPWRYVLPRIDQFQFIGRVDCRHRLRIPVLFRAHCDPVQSIGKSMSAISLHMEKVTCAMK